jgi:hypothetical protein
MAKERDDEIDTAEGFLQYEHIITFDPSNLENLMLLGLYGISERKTNYSHQLKRNTCSTNDRCVIYCPSFKYH